MNKYEHITTRERYIIASLKRKRWSVRRIAEAIDRSPSTVSRELRRNLSSGGAYRAEKAGEQARARRRRSRKKPQFTGEDYAYVNRLLRENYSPKQISNVLRLFGVLCISHETIYRHIHADKMSGGSLWKHLRQLKKNCRKRYRGRDNRGAVSGKRHITERPVSAENRSRKGHYEIDTVVSSLSKACILTLVDRKTGYVFIKKLKDRTAAETNRALKELLEEETFRPRTITADNGTEFHKFKEIEAISDVKFYFCTPYHSWERGSIEHMNGLIRQYIPKGQSMTRITQGRCDKIAKALNSRPRERYDYKPPEELHEGIKFVLHF